MSKQQIEAEVDSKAPLKIKKKPGRPKKLSQEKKVTKLEIKKDAVSEQSTRELDENKQAKDVEGLEKGTPEPRLEEITKEVENKDLEVINEKPKCKQNVCT